jgi:hypothetical protein
MPCECEGNHHCIKGNCGCLEKNMKCMNQCRCVGSNHTSVALRQMKGRGDPMLSLR